MTHNLCNMTNVKFKAMLGYLGQSTAHRYVRTNQT